MKETEKGMELVIEDAVHGPEGKNASAFFHLAPGFSWKVRDGRWWIVDGRGNDGREEAEPAKWKAGAPKKGSTRTDMEEIEAEVTVKTEKGGARADVIIHRSGDICSYAPEFGKRMKKQVMEVRFKLDNGVGVCGLNIVFQRQEAHISQ